jgi:hypothetical protein
LVRADPGTDKVRTLTVNQAAAVIGGAMPDIGYKPRNLHLASLTGNPVSAAQRMVLAGYAITDLEIVQLTVLKANSLVRMDNAGLEDITLGGVPARVSINDARQSGRSWTFVTYTWSRDGLSFALTVHLLEGLDRPEADRIAESVH